MRRPRLPDDEQARQRALDQLQILDTPAEERFDRLTRLAKVLFDVPIALVSLVDRDRQWFKSRQGLDACETSRDISFCGHAILDGGVLQVADAREDPRFFDNPLVVGPPHVRMYTGATLTTVDGYRVGTLCLIDDRPRHLNKEQLGQLRDLADAAQEELNRILLHRAASLLSDHQAYLQGVLDTVLEGIVVLDRQFRIQQANPALVDLFGYSLKDLRRRRLTDLVPDLTGLIGPERAQEFATGATLLSGEQLEGERADGGRLPLDVSLSTMLQGDEPLFIGVLSDASDRRRAESALVRAKEAAEESDRLKSEFINMVSHELRSPLTVLLGYLPLLHVSTLSAQPDALEGIVEDMETSGNHLMELINAILDLSKIEAGRMSLERQSLSLKETVGEVMQGLTVKAGDKGLELIDEISTDMRVYADPLRLRQIFHNLIGNAIKFTERGSVRVTATGQGASCSVEVLDTGIGIAEQDLPRIFEKFHQVDGSRRRQSGGTGLGLAISEELVALHGARLEVRSTLGEGTRFFFQLPTDGPARRK